MLRSVENGSAEVKYSPHSHSRTALSYVKHDARPVHHVFSLGCNLRFNRNKSYTCQFIFVSQEHDSELILNQSITFGDVGGYGETGRVVVSELCITCNGKVLIGGRDLVKGRALAAKFERNVSPLHVDVSDSRSLNELCSSCLIVVNCAGPVTVFSRRQTSPDRSVSLQKASKRRPSRLLDPRTRARYCRPHGLGEEGRPGWRPFPGRCGGSSCLHDRSAQGWSRADRDPRTTSRLNSVLTCTQDIYLPMMPRQPVGRRSGQTISIPAGVPERRSCGDSDDTPHR